jgi:hypothetical protein
MKLTGPALFLMAAQVFSYTCVMESVAVNLAPGAWAELPTQGLTTELLKNTVNMHVIFNYADEGVWDSAGGEVLFYGRGHGGAAEDTRFIAYNAKSNAWRREPRSTMFQIGHSYDHHAIDQVRRVMYYHRHGIRGVLLHRPGVFPGKELPYHVQRRRPRHLYQRHRHPALDRQEILHHGRVP